MRIAIKNQSQMLNWIPDPLAVLLQRINQNGALPISNEGTLNSKKIAGKAALIKTRSKKAPRVSIRKDFNGVILGYL
jgi:hypothetical protein